MIVMAGDSAWAAHNSAPHSTNCGRMDVSASVHRDDGADVTSEKILVLLARRVAKLRPPAPRRRGEHNERRSGSSERLVDRLLAVRGFGDDFPPVTCFQDRAQAGAHD